MKALAISLVMLVGNQALASHPHDRVCVGSAKIAGQDSVSMVLQWEIERNYDHGGPNEDSHTISIQAKSCYGDYETSDCSISTQESIILPPNSKIKSVPVSLKSQEGETFFEGRFNFGPTEQLVGKINRGPGRPSSIKDAMAKTVVNLNCVSQPKLTLGAP